jgi:hypothetical protein
MKRVILCLGLFLICQVQLVIAEDIDPKKRALIDTLLTQTGQSSVSVDEQFSNAFIQQMSMILRQSNPDIDPRAFVIIEEEVNAVIHEELVVNDSFSGMLYPIYARHFSSAELQKMIDLNNTEFGKKLIKVMPLITREVMQAGEALYRSLEPRIQQRYVERFEKEGIQ